MSWGETLWSFETSRFRVEALCHEEADVDLSFDEDGETARQLDAGLALAFAVEVRVLLDGREVASDWLGGCIYAEPRDFVTGHRDPDPMNRNCSIMRAARGGNVCICHYFPDMVRQAIARARATLRAEVPVYIRPEVAA